MPPFPTYPLDISYEWSLLSNQFVLHHIWLHGRLILRLLILWIFCALGNNWKYTKKILSKKEFSFEPQIFVSVHLLWLTMWFYNSTFQMGVSTNYTTANHRSGCSKSNLQKNTSKATNIKISFDSLKINQIFHDISIYTGLRGQVNGRCQISLPQTSPEEMHFQAWKKNILN